MTGHTGRLKGSSGHPQPQQQQHQQQTFLLDMWLQRSRINNILLTWNSSLTLKKSFFKDQKSLLFLRKKKKEGLWWLFFFCCKTRRAGGAAASRVTLTSGHCRPFDLICFWPAVQISVKIPLRFFFFFYVEESSLERRYGEKAEIHMLRLWFLFPSFFLCEHVQHGSGRPRLLLERPDR